MERLVLSVILVMLSLHLELAQLVKILDVPLVLLLEPESAQLARLVIICTTVNVTHVLTDIPQLLAQQLLLPVPLPVQSVTVKLAQLLQHVLHAKLLSTLVATLVPLVVEIVMCVIQPIMLNVPLAPLVIPSRLITLAQQIAVSPIAKLWI